VALAWGGADGSEGHAGEDDHRGWLEILEDHQRVGVEAFRERDKYARRR